MSTKKALCVGINKFKNYPDATLQGCVNDSNEMAALLKNCIGFRGKDITILHDDEATKANIMSSLTDMVEGAKNGKYSHLVFSLSSHGTQVMNSNGDEKDNADEAFCPYDLAETGDHWSKNHIILDNELHDLFAQIPNNVLLEVFLDTCHSGTGLKRLEKLERIDRKPRYILPPKYRVDRKSKGLHSLQLGNNLEKDRIQHKKQVKKSELKKGLDKGPNRHILWAACSDWQTSADAEIAGGWHGAFTYYLCEEIYASENSLSRLQLLTKVRKSLRKGRYAQTPQLECKRSTRQSKIGLDEATITSQNPSRVLLKTLS